VAHGSNRSASFDDDHYYDDVHIDVEDTAAGSSGSTE
jgi:hypothetical protein